MKLKLAISAMALCFASPSFAADLGKYDGSVKDDVLDNGLIYQGTLGVSVLHTWADGSEDSIIDDEEHFGITGLGRVSIPLGLMMSAQFDIDGTSNFLSGDEIDDNFGHAFSAAGHLSYRDPRSYLVGVFGFVGNSSAGEDEQATFYGAGIEGQLYLRNVTLYGQAGFFTGEGEDDNGDGIEDAWFVRGVGRYFFSPNSKLEAEVSYAQGDIDFGGTDADDDPMVAWGVSFERMMPRFPIAWTVGYSGSTAENKDDDTDYTDHTVRAGLKFHFGARTLLDIDRRGATLDTPTEIGRWYGYSFESID